MLEGKCALITGSTQGLGYAMAERLAADGCNIVLNGFGDAAEIEARRQRLEREYGVRALHHGADLADPRQIAALVDAAHAAFGAVDILINNAVIRYFAPIEQFEPADWDRALADWRSLQSDAGARYDRTVEIDASSLEPMISYGTNPGMVTPIGGRVPERAGDPVYARALEYMGLAPGEAIGGRPVQVVFIGSCTNARLSDLELAASVFRGRKVAPGVRALVVPGSQQIKREAEARGLAKVFIDAGAEWRESGCSMCLGMNGDTVDAGLYCVSTSNRNFEGRQGAGARTLLASPATAAAAAVTGRVTDPREFIH